MLKKDKNYCLEQITTLIKINDDLQEKIKNKLFQQEYIQETKNFSKTLPTSEIKNLGKPII